MQGVEEAVTGGNYIHRLIARALSYASKSRWLPNDSARDCFELQGLRRELARLVDLAQSGGTGGDAMGEARRLAGQLDKLDKDYCRGSPGDQAQVAWSKAADKVKDFRRDAPVPMTWGETYALAAQIGFPGMPGAGRALSPQMRYTILVLAATLLVPEGVAAAAVARPEWLEQALAAPAP